MTKRKKKIAKKRPSLVRQMSAEDLCASLVAIAAFHVEDKPAQMKIYEAVRRLQLLEDAAVKAGLVPATPVV